MGAEDRILDYAIALEILYRLDSSELTYKLGTRTAYLLAKTPQRRYELFDKVRRFYRVRSAVAHGNMPEPDILRQAQENGRKLACDTLSALLRRGEFPDWNQLVMMGDQS